MNERTERIAQPRRRSGWVTGELWYDGRPASVNLAHVTTIYASREPDSIAAKGAEKVHYIMFEYPGGGEEGLSTRLRRTEDLLRQLNEEGLG